MSTEETRSNSLRLVVLNGQEVGDEAPEGGGGGDGGGGEGDAVVQRVWCSDDMLAAKLSEALADDWRYVPKRDAWFRWTGRRWECEELGKVFNLSREVCRGVALQVDTGKLQRDVSSKSRIYAAVALAGKDPRHATALEEFDRDDWRLNTPLGIVDLRTGQLLDHDRSALMTRMTTAGPGPDDRCPKFLAYLREATGGDEQLQRFLQRVAGYCLTGSIEEHAIFFLYGPGGTGKSMFLLLLFELLADYATKAEMEIFTVATGERHSAPLATLHGARLVIASETDEGKRWDEAKLKSITGGDPITANFMRGNPFTFRPKFKLLIAGNHRPRLRSADDAMRRRLHVIPFKVKPAQINKGLIDELRPELGGILKWAIEGELERQRIGLSPPRVVVEATDEYFEAENTIGRWVDERCIKGPQLTAPTKGLYADFKSWAARAGEFAVSERLFLQKLLLMAGIEPWRDRTQRGVRGVALRETGADLFDGATPAPRGAGGLSHDPGGAESWRADPGDDYPRE